MNLSNSILVSSVEPLRTLSGVALPIKASFAVATSIKKIDDALRVFEGERMKLVEKYGAKGEDARLKLDDKGSAEILDPEAFSADLSELLSCEQELDIKPIPLSILGDAPLTPATMTMLSWLVDGEA